jgi:hypothetical protein
MNIFLTDVAWEIWTKNPASLVPGWNVRLDRSFGCFPDLGIPWETASITAWEMSKESPLPVPMHTGSIGIRENFVRWQLVSENHFDCDDKPIMTRSESLVGKDAEEARRIVKLAAEDVVEWLRTRPNS